MMSERMSGTSLCCVAHPPRNAGSFASAFGNGASFAKSLEGLNALTSRPVPSVDFAPLDRDFQSQAGHAINDSFPDILLGQCETSLRCDRVPPRIGSFQAQPRVEWCFCRATPLFE